MESGAEEERCKGARVQVKERARVRKNGCFRPLMDSDHSTCRASFSPQCSNAGPFDSGGTGQLDPRCRCTRDAGIQTKTSVPGSEFPSPRKRPTKLWIHKKLVVTTGRIPVEERETIANLPCIESILYSILGRIHHKLQYLVANICIQKKKAEIGPFRTAWLC